jgi:hypothetical protein
MINKALAVCLFFFAQRASAQKLTFEVPTKIQAKVGQELNIKLDVTGIQKFTIRVEGSPPSSQLQNNKFIWTPKADEAKNYFVKFFLKDSLGVMQNEADMALSVEPETMAPGLAFDRILADTINVVEDESFFFSASVKSGRGSDPKSVMVYFLFNESPDVRSFDSCRINRMGDQILFGWTPSNRESIKGYAKLRITLIDTDNSISSQVLNFKIKNINQKPDFRMQIPDTVFIPGNGELTLDFSAADPDHDNLKYDYTPKSPLYYLLGSKIIFNPNQQSYDSKENPIHLLVSATDGEHKITRSVCLMRTWQYRQPTIGDFTRKEFDEGDSLITYLNLSNDTDLRQFDIKLNDLALPRGIGNLTNHLIFEKGSSYIKVRSKGALPYYLVDRDFTYNIAVTVTSKNGKVKPVFKVLELTVNDRPDPTSIGHQKDSLLEITNKFLKIENSYKDNLEKMQKAINRPWWKKAAVVTGTLSGVLSLVQSQDPKKSISIIAAAISLMSITVTNLPSLNEKTLSELTDKISNSKGRIDRIQEKELDFRANWSLDIDRVSFDKLKADLLERISKGSEKRKEEVCSLFQNKILKRKIDKLLKTKSSQSNNPLDVKHIFNCTPKT